MAVEFMVDMEESMAHMVAMFMEGRLGMGMEDIHLMLILSKETGQLLNHKKKKLRNDQTEFHHIKVFKILNFNNFNYMKIAKFVKL